MTFCIRSEDTREADYLDIDRALCGECEKHLKWGIDSIADCCGYRYKYWTSTVSFHRTKIAAPPRAAGERNK